MPHEGKRYNSYNTKVVADSIVQVMEHKRDKYKCIKNSDIHADEEI